MKEGLEIIKSSFPRIAQQIPVTLEMFIIFVLLAFVISVPFAIIRVKKRGILYPIVSLIVSFFRGTPMTVQIFVIFFGMPVVMENFGVNANLWNPIVFPIIALGLNQACYYCEAWRSAYLSIDKGQIEAGKSIGFGTVQNFLNVIAPQCLRVAMPNMKNLTTEGLKSTALAFSIGVVDIMGKAHELCAVHFGLGSTWIYLAASLLYWAIDIVIEIVFTVIAKINSKGFEVIGEKKKRKVKTAAAIGAAKI